MASNPQARASFEPSRVGPLGPAGGWLRRRVLWPLRQQLAQGATPDALAQSLAIGAALGLFPVLGSTTVLCLAAGVALRLNHPALQIANYLVAALQLPLVYAFVRLGESLVGADPASFSIPGLVVEMRADPAGFLAHWGLTGLHGILGWALVAPFLAWGAYAVLARLLGRLAQRLQQSSPAAPASA